VVGRKPRKMGEKSMGDKKSRISRGRLMQEGMA
jgi:hypothetical protein